MGVILNFQGAQGGAKLFHRRRACRLLGKSVEVALSLQALRVNGHVDIAGDSVAAGQVEPQPSDILQEDKEGRKASDRSAATSGSRMKPSLVGSGWASNT